MLEAALSQGKPVARVVRDGKQQRLGLAAPVAGKVVYLPLPLELLTTSFEGANVPERGYVGLRQGSYTVSELGRRDLASGAESLARPVGKTGLRVVAARRWGGADGLVSPPFWLLCCSHSLHRQLLVAR